VPGGRNTRYSNDEMEQKLHADTEILLWNMGRNSKLTVKSMLQKTQDTTKQVVTT